MEAMAFDPTPTETGKSARRLLLGSAAAGASWMALVAATTLGLPVLQRLRAEVSVSAQELPRETLEEYRLVVHSYPAESVVNGVPQEHARPCASAQRAVTTEELARGVAVDVMAVGAEEAREASVIVAWVERGAPDLEFDARRARPSREAYVGTVAADELSEARVVLTRRA